MYIRLFSYLCTQKPKDSPRVKHNHNKNMTDMSENAIRSRLERMEEDVLDVRSDMENEIRDFMVHVLNKNTMEIDVEDPADKEIHHVVITITPLSPDGDGDADLMFTDYTTGCTNASIRDYGFSTDLMSVICAELSEMPVEG